MSSEFNISRRKFLGAAAGAAGMAALGPFAARGVSAGSANAIGERIVPAGKLSVQQFSIRDAITRRSIANSRANGLAPAMGYLGGPDFPANPADLGPLVELPGGFEEVFAYLASVGYRGMEFFSFSQNVNELGRQPTPAEIRTYLDNAGLSSTGTHTGGLSMVNPVTRQTQIDIAHTLGHEMIGTAGDPVGGTAANLLANWQTAASNYNIVGAALAAEGLKMYLHPEQNNFNFFNDPAHPELSRVHRLDWFVDNTDPSLVFLEPDILHMYAGRARFPDRVDGTLFDVWGYLTRIAQRVVAWHVKDGSRLNPAPAPGVNPFTQTIVRPPQFTGTPASNVDTIYTLEGSIGQGYPVDPDPAVLGFKRIFGEIGAKGSHYAIIESDSGPGPAADPGRSLRHAKISAGNLLGLRGGVQPKRHSTVSDEATYESDESLAG
jgi:sugar phosphate isomerase/epimerase